VHRRQLREHAAGGRDVVEADHGDVVRDLQAAAVDGVDGAERHLVVRGEDGGRRDGEGEQLFRRRIAARLHERAVDDERRIGRDAGRLQRIDVAPLALRALPRARIAGDVGDAAVAQLQQVVHGHARAEAVFRRHDGHREGTRIEADHDAGHLLALDGVQEAVVRTGHHDHQPVAQLAQQVARRHAVRAVEAFRVEQQQVVALGARVRAQRADDLVQHDGAVIVDEHAEQAAAVPAHAARQRIGRVIQLRGGGHDALARLGRHITRAADRARCRDRGHAREPGDFTEFADFTHGGKSDGKMRQRTSQNSSKV